jgi:hypothetical protein
MNDRRLTNDPPASDPEPIINTTGRSATPLQIVAWARLWAVAHPHTRPMLRSGAWYPVLNLGPDQRERDALLEVRHSEVAVPVSFLEVRTQRPRSFTVVYRSRTERNPAEGTRKDLGNKYAVCPASGHRIRLQGEPLFLECPGCGYRGEVAWNETG